MRTYDLGDNATGVIADENDWNRRGPRIVTPRKTAWGTVTGLYSNSDNAVIIRTDSGETHCIRVDIR
jgi:hypothetical protein